MPNPSGFTQLTFHYADGRTESYQVYDLENSSPSPQEIQQHIKRLFDKPWWILHLQEETIAINMANVIKVEIKPAIPEIIGEEVFSDAQRVTALTRGTRL
ncbi:MAG TPA: hypothetical protein V6D15_22170 [Oculatellaceae cyanobacterium]|jgi:SOS-response transcriptional repressor LexA